MILSVAEVSYGNLLRCSKGDSPIFAPRKSGQSPSRLLMSVRCLVALAAAAFVLAATVPAQAEWSLTWLGPLGGDSGNSAYAVSADGSVVVGESTEGEYHIDYQPEAFRWTQADGMLGLDFLPGHAWSEAHDVSADGSVIVGYSQESIGEDQYSGGEAFRWTEAGGMQGLADPLVHDHSWAYGVSADGSVVVGYNRGIGELNRTAFRWTEAEGMVDLELPADPPGGEYSRAYAVSADGSTVVGYWGGPSPLASQKPFRWTASEGMVDLGLSGTAFDVSADGSVVVGEAWRSSTLEAFLWTEAGGVVGLGFVPGSDNWSNAHAVSDDGSLVVGNSEFRAFLWDDVHGMRDLNDLLAADGVDLQGGVLHSAKDVSIDGQTIVLVGEGLAPDGSYQAWRAVIPEPSSLAALVSMALVGLWVCIWRRRSL